MRQILIYTVIALISCGLASCIKFNVKKDLASFIYDSVKVNNKEIRIKEGAENGIKTLTITISLKDIANTLNSLVITMSSPTRIENGTYYVGDVEHPQICNAEILYKNGSSITSHLGYITYDTIDEGIQGGKFQFFFYNTESDKLTYIESGNYRIYE
ncbi:MAG: hypothetical protein IKW11_04290 [Bacteroidales bacterium]|nr:hypothetical protein [Bacteroidales bacterium]